MQKQKINTLVDKSYVSERTQFVGQECMEKPKQKEG